MRDQQEITPIERTLLLRAAQEALQFPSGNGQNPVPHGAPLDWQRVLLVASQHAVSQLLAIACQSRRDLPEAVARKLARSSARLAVMTLRQARELVRILKILQDDGVRALAIKGPALAALAYPNPTVRPSSDLDVMVDPTDAERAIALLDKAGFKRPASSSAEAGDLSLDNEQTLLSPDGNTTVELHWALLPMGHALPCTFGELWGRAQIVQLTSGPVHTLGLEDLFLYLCQHGTKHGWERLMWVCDIAMLMPLFSEPAWTALFARCRRAGTLRMVLLGLSLAQNLLGITLPPPARRLVRAHSALKSLSARVERRMFETGSHTQGLATHTRSFLFNLAVRERLRDRFRFGLWAVKPTARDHGSLPLPRPFEMFYFLLRPFRVLIRHAIWSSIELKKAV